MLCTHKTTILCQFGLFCHQLTTISPSILIHFWWELYQINSLIIRLRSYQSNQHSIQRELLMPSPEVIDLTLSDDETQPDPIRSDQGTSMPTRATNRLRTSSSTPPTSGINRTRRIFPVIQGTFAAIEQAENYLPLQPFFNNTHFGQTLFNCIHNQHRLGIPDEYFVETCINTYTQNGFVTKEFVRLMKTPRPRITPSSTSDSRARLLPSPLTTKTSLKGCFPHLSLRLETFQVKRRTVKASQSS